MFDIRNETILKRSEQNDIEWQNDIIGTSPKSVAAFTILGTGNMTSNLFTQMKHSSIDISRDTVNQNLIYI